MSNRVISLVENEFYHIYNRGTDKRVIFKTPSDHRRFQELLYLANTVKAISYKDIKKQHDSIYEHENAGSLVAIGAYCLMPNHFHLLATPLVENGISKFMAKLSTGYSMYFNKKYDRTGGLFQGTFKSQHANTDEYLKYLYAYIHLNPVKLIDPEWKEKGVKDLDKSYDFAASFQYSSLPDYLGIIRPENAILNPATFPEYFTKPHQHKKELFE